VTADVRELLPLYALGALDDDDARAVERAAAADPAIAAELAALREVAAQLIVAVSPIAPPPDVAQRLMASAGAGRFERWSSRMAQLFDVSVERARELLGLIERPASWGPAVLDGWTSGIPHVALVHFTGGPACATADCGFVRIDPGHVFPLHRHRGDEVTILIAGTIREDDGRIFHAGDEIARAAGTEHTLTVIGDEPAIIIARAEGGIEVRR
jgi:hypothetical protein